VNGPFRVLAGVPDAASEQEIAALLEEAGDAVLVGASDDAAGLFARLAAQPVEVIALHAGLGPLPVLEVARELSARFPDVGVVLLTGDVSADLLRAALSSGVRDVVRLPIAFEELQAAIAHAARWSRSVRTRLQDDADDAVAAAAGSMVAVAGAKGGVRATTIALHLARAVSRQRRSVCLQTGDVRHLLDISHRRSISDLVDVADAVSARQLDDSLYQHASGLRVLLPPQHGERAEEVTGAATRQILGAIRSRFDVVIVDVGAVVTEACAVAMHMANQAIVVVTPDVLALRSANRLLALWDRLRVDTAVRVLINKADRANEVQSDMVARVVDADVLSTTVPAAFRTLEPAINTGDPERAQSAPLQRSMERLASELELTARPEAPATRARARTRRRLLPATEAGQVAVETVGIMPLVLLIVVLLWQMALVGTTFVLGEHAAREGARELSVDDDARAAAMADLPVGWQRSAAVSTTDDRVDVALRVPALFPGVSSPWTITTSAGAIREGGS
jgi:pilus assembly protein CpaE